MRDAVPDDLGLDAGWSIRELAFEYIVTLAVGRGCRRMLEFGSGASTARWLLAMPQLSLVSIDHDRSYLERARRLAQREGVAGRARFEHAPLTEYRQHGRTFSSYATVPLEGEFDLVVIDGPPSAAKGGREMCLYLVNPRLPIGATVVLDDAFRQAEREVVESWRDVYPGGFDVDLVSLGNGLAVLTKLAQ